MRISATLTDRLLYKALPMGLLAGLISAFFNANQLSTFLIFTVISTFAIWILEVFMIRNHFGKKRNKITISYNLLFNDKIMALEDIMLIETCNIYPNPQKWNIATIKFHLSNSTTFEVLAKPNSIFDYIFNISKAKKKDRNKRNIESNSQYFPESSYLSKETNKTLTLLFEHFPSLRNVRK